MSGSDECSGGSGEDLGPLGLDYYHIYRCGFDGNPLFGVVLLLWIALLIYFLGQTADGYFSPTLATICEKLNIPFDIAGVTFLAFGNGTPDVFASLASFTTAANPMLGVGALLGAGMFVTTVVAGSVFLAADIEVSPTSFVRDAGSYIIAAVTLVFLFIIGVVTLTHALLFVGLYFCYVGVVAALWYFTTKREQEKAENDGDLPGAVMSAFWHTPEDLRVQKLRGQSTTRQHKPTQERFTYTFLIGDNADDDDEMLNGDGQDEDEPIGQQQSPLAASFGHAIISDYFHGATTPGDSSTSKPQPQVAPRQQQRLSINSEPDEEEADPMTPNQRFERPLLQKQQSSVGRVFASLYWQNYRWQKRVRRQILTSDWWDKPIPLRAFELFEAPVVFFRNWTIPTLEDESWSKLNAVLHPILSPLFCIFVTGNMSTRVGSAYLWAVCLPFSLILSGVVCLITHTSGPPRNRFLSAVWLFTSFGMCIFWVYLFASEMVSALQTLGLVMGVSPSVLALTVLAWGNSVGDFFTNVSVAKQGLGRMAIAGCFGGPIFNLLIGLGGSLVYSTSLSYPQPLDFKPDVHAVISAFFLICNLLLVLVYVFYSGFRFHKRFGFVLLGVYGVYTIVQLIATAIKG